MKSRATHKNTFERNWSSANSGLWGEGAGRPSPKLNVEAKKPKGKAPIPNDMWNPPSPKPKFGNVCYQYKYLHIFSSDSFRSNSKTTKPNDLRVMSVMSSHLVSYFCSHIDIRLFCSPMAFHSIPTFSIHWKSAAFFNSFNIAIIWLIIQISNSVFFWRFLVFL